MHGAVLHCAHCYVIIWYLAVQNVLCGERCLVMSGILVGACLCCSLHTRMPVTLTVWGSTLYVSRVTEVYAISICGISLCVWFVRRDEIKFMLSVNQMECHGM